MRKRRSVTSRVMTRFIIVRIVMRIVGIKLWCPYIIPYENVPSQCEVGNDYFPTEDEAEIYCTDKFERCPLYIHKTGKRSHKVLSFAVAITFCLAIYAILLSIDIQVVNNIANHWIFIVAGAILSVIFSSIVSYNTK